MQPDESPARPSTEAGWRLLQAALAAFVGMCLLDAVLIHGASDSESFDHSALAAIPAALLLFGWTGRRPLGELAGWQRPVLRLVVPILAFVAWIGPAMTGLFWFHLFAGGDI